MICKNYKIIITIVFYLLAIACSKEVENPFDKDDNDPGETINPYTPDPRSIEGLHHNIFKPTCSNSGCHDGNFEPDFRTPESSYNTLVYHPVIKNDVEGAYQYRVFPFDAERSILITRMTKDIDGYSGIMPLTVDPNSDWNVKKEEYIQNIRDWINEGARDFTGNFPALGYNEPRMQGVTGLAGGINQPLERNSGNSHILIPPGATGVELWISVVDDSIPAYELSHNKIKFSTSRDNFQSASEQNLTVTQNPKTENGYFDEPVSYHHRFTIDNPASYGPPGTVVYFRVYVKNDQLPVTEIPSNGSFNHIKDYFSFKLQ